MSKETIETAFELEPGQMVGCYHCMQSGVRRSYARGEAFLVGPGHPPCDAEANYVCKAHLIKDVEFFDPYSPENKL